MPLQAGELEPAQELAGVGADVGARGAQPRAIVIEPRGDPRSRGQEM